MKLLHVIAFTSEIDRMKEFYRDGLGLKVATESPFWVSFESEPGGGGFALLAVRPEQKREVELCFESADVRAEHSALRARGVEFLDEVQEQAFGNVVHLRDPEGNLLSLLQPAADPGGESRAQAASFGEPQWGDAEGSAGDDVAVALEATARVATVAVNVRDLAAARAYYRDRLGLEITVENGSEVRFRTGPVDVTLHSKISPPARERQLGQPITIGVVVQDLLEWGEVARERGVHFTTIPADEGYGWFAEALDPDGNRVTFREPDDAEGLEEQMALPFEEDDAPRRTAIRRSVKKGSKAVSRVVLKPDYKVARKKANAQAKAAARALEMEAVKAVAGGGPITRPVSAARADKRSTPESEKMRPAVGRLKKAQRRTLLEKKKAVAQASRKKAVKRAAAQASRKKADKRAVAKAGRKKAVKRVAARGAKKVAKRGAKKK